MMRGGIDWPKIVMGGVVLLGGYAVYRLVSAEEPKALPPKPPEPTAPWIPIPGAPPVAPPKAEPGKPRYLGDPISLEQGKSYRAVGGLSTREAMALGFGDKKQALGARFSDLGFRNVRVYDDLSELPFNWPTETVASAALPDRPFMIEGVWEKASTSLPKPPQIVRAWEA